MNGLACPRCTHLTSTLLRHPVWKKGMYIRRHRCSECMTIFRSAQMVVGEKMEAVVDILRLMETQP